MLWVVGLVPPLPSQGLWSEAELVPREERLEVFPCTQSSPHPRPRSGTPLHLLTLMLAAHSVCIVLGVFFFSFFF